jgi:hypothetical protein
LGEARLFEIGLSISKAAIAVTKDLWTEIVAALGHRPSVALECLRLTWEHTVEHVAQEEALAGNG